MCLVALSGSGAGDHVTRMRTASKLKGLKRTSQREISIYSKQIFVPLDPASTLKNIATYKLKRT